MKIQLQSVHHIYGKGDGARKVLEDVNLTLKEGEFVSVMGPSGTGKSTLLNLLGCLDYPTYGQIMLEERDVTKCSESFREKIRLNHIGFLFQSSHLLPTLTVEENVLLPMQLIGLGSAERKERCKSLLQVVGMHAQASQMARLLSGGQQQKVGLARALANLPGLLLADEPTGNLDEKSGLQILEVLKQVNRSQKVTIVMVTHDPVAARYASKQLYLNKGQLDERAP